MKTKTKTNKLYMNVYEVKFAQFAEHITAIQKPKVKKRVVKHFYF